MCFWVAGFLRDKLLTSRTPTMELSRGRLSCTAFTLPRCPHAQSRADEAMTRGGKLSVLYCSARGGGCSLRARRLWADGVVGFGQSGRRVRR